MLPSLAGSLPRALCAWAPPGRAGFPVLMPLPPPQSRHRAPLECCTAAPGTACERSRSAGRSSGEPFGARAPAVLPGLAAVAGPAESAAGRPAHVRPEACLLCHNLLPIYFSCMPVLKGLFPTTEYTSKQASDPVVPLVPCTGIFLGPSKSGKTVALISLILEQYRGVFERIYVFNPSVNSCDRPCDQTAFLSICFSVSARLRASARFCLCLCFSVCVSVFVVFASAFVSVLCHVLLSSFAPFLSRFTLFFGEVHFLSACRG